MRTFRGQYDNFDSIRVNARRKIDSGEMTHDEALAWIAEQDAKEYAEADSRVELPPKPEIPTSFSDQGHMMSNGSFKNADGSIVEPEEKHITKWGET